MKLFIYLILFLSLSFSQTHDLGFGYSNFYKTDKFDLKTPKKVHINNVSYRLSDLYQGFGFTVDYTFENENLYTSDYLNMYMVSLQIGKKSNIFDWLDLDVGLSINLSSLNFETKINGYSYNSLDRKVFWSPQISALFKPLSFFVLHFQVDYSTLKHQLWTLKGDQPLPPRPAIVEYWQGDWSFSGIKYKVHFYYEFSL